MWLLMMFGPEPFRQAADGRTELNLQPFIPAKLIPEDGIVEATFLGKCTVRYRIPGRESLIPGSYRISAYTADGKSMDPETLAVLLREEQVDVLDVWIER